MVTKLCYNYKLTRGMCLFRFQSLSSLCALFLPFILRNMVIFFFMLQSHSDALIFRINTFHIRRHKIILRNLIFQVKHYSAPIHMVIRPCMLLLLLSSQPCWCAQVYIHQITIMIEVHFKRVSICEFNKIHW